MQIQKKSKIFIVFIILLTIAVFCLFKRKKPSVLSNQFVVNRLESKLVNYKKQPDNFYDSLFFAEYRKALARILSVKNNITCIGERIDAFEKHPRINLFILSRVGKLQFVTFLKSEKGNLTEFTYAYKDRDYQLPEFCDNHYFYLSKNDSLDHDSYSLTTIHDGVYRDIKVFNSASYNRFTNVRSQCDSFNIIEARNFINETFEKEGK